MKKACSIILSALLVINIWVISAESKEGVGILSKLPFAFVPIVGGSMEPRFGEGDAVFAVQTPYEKLSAGDTIIFAQGLDLVVHDIIELDSEGMTTQGLANKLPDGRVLRSQYRAKVLFKVPGLGAIWRITSTPKTFTFFAVMIIIIIFGKDVFGYLYKLIYKES